MGPILLKPTYISPIWGGTRISEARGLEHGDDVNNGEAFDVSAHPDVCTSVEGGPFDGTRFDELIAKHHDELIGDLADDATIQVVSMDPKEFLSVQVHPDETYAQAAEGDHEKAESWYILHAEPGAELIAGCTTSDVDALREAAADDTIGDRYGRRVEMHEGDFILIPAGTMHALGPGIFAVEIGSFGNTTYRLCDWGRGRELHVDKGFDVLKTDNETTVEHLGIYDEAAGTRVRRGVTHRLFESNVDNETTVEHLGIYDEAAGTRVRRGVTHRLFESNVVDVAGEWHVEKGGRYQILTCVHGTATIETSEGTVELGYTRSCVIPACVREFTVRGNCRVLQSYRP